MKISSAMLIISLKSNLLFLVSIIVSLLLAGFILIPEISTLIKSVRVSGGVESDSTGFDYFDSMKIVYNTYRRHKQFIMYGSEMAVGLLLLVVFKGKYAIRKYADNIILLVILMANSFNNKILFLSNCISPFIPPIWELIKVL